MKHLLAFVTVVVFLVVMQPKKQKRQKQPENLPKAEVVLEKTTIKASAPQRVVPKASKKAHETLKSHHNPSTDLNARIQVNRSYRHLPQGLVVANNVRAIESKNYQKEMGPILGEQSNLLFIEVNGQDSHADLAQVVWDKNNQRFYPISTVLKVEGVDQDAREKLKNEGFDEHYYHEGIKAIFIQSNNSEILELYRHLQGLGHVVQLEIIRAYHKQR